MPCATATESNSSALLLAAEFATGKLLGYKQDALQLHLRHCNAKPTAVTYVDTELLGRNLAAGYQDPHSVDL